MTSYDATMYTAIILLVTVAFGSIFYIVKSIDAKIDELRAEARATHDDGQAVLFARIIESKSLEIQELQRQLDIARAQVLAFSEGGAYRTCAPPIDEPSDAPNGTPHTVFRDGFGVTCAKTTEDAKVVGT